MSRNAFSLLILTASLIATVFSTTGCAQKNGGGSTVANNTPTAPTTAATKAVGPSEGGILDGKTQSNFSINASHGQALSSISGTTANGYQVRFNIQGQIAQ